MGRLSQIYTLPLPEFSAELARGRLAPGELRSAVEMLSQMISTETYDKQIVEAYAPVWESLLHRALDEGDMTAAEVTESTAHLALVLVGKFDRDDHILFLSPPRVADLALEHLPLSLDEVSSMVPVTRLADAGIDNLRKLRTVKGIMRPTVKLFSVTGTADERMQQWSQALPLIP